MQVYLPDDLYDELKQRGLPASELLQEAVRTEIRRQMLLEATDAFVKVLVDEVGEPTARDIAQAEALVARMRGSEPRRKAG